MKINEEIKADGYTLAEILGREKTQFLLGDKANLVWVEERSAPYDITGSTLTQNFYIEVKCRNCKSDAFDSDLLEYSKLKRMQNVEPDAIHYYLVFYSDNKARLYHLNKIKIQDVYVGMFLCPDSSVEDKGEVMKLCYELPHHLAKAYKF